MMNFEIDSTNCFTSKTDLCAHIAMVLGLSTREVEVSVTKLRHTFGRYEDLDKTATFALERAVWDDVTDGAEWPF